MEEGREGKGIEGSIVLLCKEREETKGEVPS